MVCSKELNTFLEWIAQEIEYELDNPNTTLCRDMRCSIESYFRRAHRTVDKNILIDLMIYNVVEEFMDRPFAKALSNLNIVQRDNRFTDKEMLLQLPINCLVLLLNAEKNKKKIQLRYSVRSFHQSLLRQLALIP